MKKDIYYILKKVLRNEGLRFTKQRQAIWEEIDSSSDHLDAEKIYYNIKSNNLYVSRATVYRTLEILVKNNLIRKLDVGDGRIRYERKRTGEHHDHMICLETGKIIEFYNEELEILQVKIAKDHGYKLIKHSHQLFVKPIQ